MDNSFCYFDRLMFRHEKRFEDLFAIASVTSTSIPVVDDKSLAVVTNQEYQNLIKVNLILPDKLGYSFSGLDGGYLDSESYEQEEFSKNVVENILNRNITVLSRKRFDQRINERQKSLWADPQKQNVFFDRTIRPVYMSKDIRQYFDSSSMSDYGVVYDSPHGLRSARNDEVERLYLIFARPLPDTDPDDPYLFLYASELTKTDFDILKYNYFWDPLEMGHATDIDEEGRTIKQAKASANLDDRVIEAPDLQSELDQIKDPDAITDKPKGTDKGSAAPLNSSTDGLNNIPTTDELAKKFDQKDD